MLRLTGDLLDDLYAVKEVLLESNYDALMREASESKREDRRDGDESYRQITAVIPSAWQAARCLSTALSVPAFFHPEELEAAQAAAGEPRLEDLWDGTPISDLAKGLDLLLTLAPADLTGLTTGPWRVELSEVMDLIGAIAGELDRLERAVNHRGKWPR